MHEQDPLKRLLSAEEQVANDGDDFVSKVMTKLRRRAFGRQALIMAAAATAVSAVWIIASPH